MERAITTNVFNEEREREQSDDFRSALSREQSTPENIFIDHPLANDTNFTQVNGHYLPDDDDLDEEDEEDDLVLGDEDDLDDDDLDEDEIDVEIDDTADDVAEEDLLLDADDDVLDDEEDEEDDL